MTRARSSRRDGILGLALGLLACTALAQEPPPQEEPPATSPPEGAEKAPETKAQRPGRFRVGPFYLTPTFRVYTVGFDSNVFYTATERRADFTALGGPGLDVVLPVRSSLRLSGNGGLSYLYFVRTPSQRRLTSSLLGQLDWGGTRTGLLISSRQQTELNRPSLEVDRRLPTKTTVQHAEVWRRLFGRTSLRLTGEWARREIEEDVADLGVDLRRALSQDRYTAGGELDYALTVKTSLAALGERAYYRMIFDPSRDADVDRAMGGLRADPTALVSGRALAGVAWMRPRDRSLGRLRVVVADVDATLNLSSRTRIGGSYRRDIGYSAYAASASTFMLTTEQYGLRLDKDLIGNLNLELFARRSWISGDGDTEVTLPDGTTARGFRRDRADEAGGDLGYRFRSRLRIGIAASYLRRRSTISYFGIEGLLVGLTVRYTP